MGDRHIKEETTVHELEVLLRSFGLRVVITFVDRNGHADIMATVSDGETIESSFGGTLAEAVDSAFQRWVHSHGEKLKAEWAVVS